jgi:hypothetical protein
MAYLPSGLVGPGGILVMISFPSSRISSMIEGGTVQVGSLALLMILNFPVGVCQTNCLVLVGVPRATAVEKVRLPCWKGTASGQVY